MNHQRCGMKYRFTAEDFYCVISKENDDANIIPDVTEIANALLEQWEKESETVYGHPGHWQWTTRNLPILDCKAILWNPEKIGEKK